MSTVLILIMLPSIRSRRHGWLQLHCGQTRGFYGYERSEFKDAKSSTNLWHRRRQKANSPLPLLYNFGPRQHQERALFCASPTLSPLGTKLLRFTRYFQRAGHVRVGARRDTGLRAKKSNHFRKKQEHYTKDQIFVVLSGGWWMC